MKFPESVNRSYVQSFLSDRLGGDVDAPHRKGVVSEAMFGSDTRQYRLHFNLYDKPTGDCR